MVDVNGVFEKMYALTKIYREMSSLCVQHCNGIDLISHTHKCTHTSKERLRQKKTQTEIVRQTETMDGSTKTNRQAENLNHKIQTITHCHCDGFEWEVDVSNIFVVTKNLKNSQTHKKQ